VKQSGGKGGTFGVAKRLTGERAKKTNKTKDSQGHALKQKTFALGESADQLRGSPWDQSLARDEYGNLIDPRVQSKIPRSDIHSG
jgi:hypothetical protein